MMNYLFIFLSIKGIITVFFIKILKNILRVEDTNEISRFLKKHVYAFLKPAALGTGLLNCTIFSIFFLNINFFTTWDVKLKKKYFLKNFSDRYFAPFALFCLFLTFF